MAAKEHPACKKCRRAGDKLFLKGERCFTAKCAIVKRNYPPGIHGQQRRTRLSDYGLQLQAKQKAKRIYGINEKQLLNYFKKASSKKDDTGVVLLQLLEKRLDNVIYRLGFAKSRALARQLVNHGHFFIDDKKVNIPSFQVNSKNKIRINPSKEDNTYTKALKEVIEKHEPPGWMSLDGKALAGKIVNNPTETDLDLGIDTKLIIEFYSR